MWHVYLCSHNFGQKNHTTTSLVRSYNNTTMIRSKKYGYDGSGLGCNPNTIPLHSRVSRHMKELSCTHMKHTTIHRQNDLVMKTRMSLERIRVIQWYGSPTGNRWFMVYSNSFYWSVTKIVRRGKNQKTIFAFILIFSFVPLIRFVFDWSNRPNER